jgi:NAD-dependent DNA ligase
LESRSKAIADVGPAVSDLVARVEAFAADGVWAKEELVELQSLLEAFGSHRIAGNEPSKPLTHIFDEPQPSITYPGKGFVLSGQFAYGRKNLVIDVIESKGGVVHTNVRRSTDYLLVGSFVSEGWAHGSYGRKIEAAMEGRAAGHGIAIVSEARSVATGFHKEARRITDSTGFGIGCGGRI